MKALSKNTTSPGPHGCLLAKPQGREYRGKEGRADGMEVLLNLGAIVVALVLLCVPGSLIWREITLSKLRSTRYFVDHSVRCCIAAEQPLHTLVTAWAAQDGIGIQDWLIDRDRRQARIPRVPLGECRS